MAHESLKECKNKEDGGYKKEISELQKMIVKSAEALFAAKIPLIIVFEGWDAAGKSGCIRRITKTLDTKKYRIVPVSAPTPEELNYNYLWRFWQTVPEKGHITIYDRSWYGRVLVERVEGLCTEPEWTRAYREINAFERTLTDDGTLIIKFWLDISEEEQLKRFRAREKNPEKAYKITDEDWRNRAKREIYESALSDMLDFTDMPNAGWHVIPANDKKSARIQVMKMILEFIDSNI